MANKSNSSNQVISLPKGGGALHGIGETFSPDLHTGTGNFSVPIALPPGRSQFQSQLSLVYSTGNGNGPFGLGWGLSIPGVSRKTSRGIPRYVDEDDTFLLSGAEDLVLVAEMAGAKRYRPRTEGLFARIEHRRDTLTDHWEVRSKDGLVSVYGTPRSVQDDPATIANPENRGQIFHWQLTETQDPFGNVIRYDYERDLGDTSDHLWDQLYLKRIRYVDYTDSQAGEKFLVSATFNYEERPDPFSEYRPGFEIRTTRRCTSIEIRTHADRERVVRVYRLIYLDQRGLPIEQLPLNSVSLLNQVVVEGHDGERRESLPPLEFGYTAFEPTQRRYQPFGGSRPERSLGHPEYELVDLFGNGLPTVLEINEQVRYWRNRGNGQFDLVRTMETAPAGVKLSDPGVQLLDANGNGRADLMVIDGLRNGYYPLTFDGQWNERGFVRYRSVPTVDIDAPDVRLMDLDGDGVTDALRTGPQFELYYNDPDDGWSAIEMRERTASDDFPNVSFEDPRVKLGDMTGDGLQDILLIHNGRVEYWPYRGYGRWGRRVAMRNSPRFEDAAFFPGIGFDPKRVLLGDVDGDGVADLVYVSSGHVTVWINQDGNAWSDPIVIHGTPPVTDATAVRLADMLGTGTDGILWSYDFGAFPDSTYKFLDLTGGVKPYVLDQMDNHMGAVTRVYYAASTRFYVEDDERPETRWRTPLPFPVQVVARVEVIDQISHGKLTTEYRYHHGYWDGTEREFRGFGMVEQFDTETFAEYHAVGAHGPDTRFEPVLDKHFSPPLLTKTWFHQGPVDEETGDWQELDWSPDYWPGDPQALAHTDAVNAFLHTLADPRHRRDALRTLRGSTLRSELYALDSTDRQNRPYTVTEQAYGLREEIPPESGDAQRQRIFFPHPLAQRTTQWERGDEPMTQFGFTDDYDAYGQSRRQVSLGVPRHRDYRATAPAGEPYLSTAAETQYAQRDEAQGYMVNRVFGSASFEILNDGSATVFELYRQIREGTAARKLIGQTFNYYDGDAFVGMPLGQLGDFGALVRAESLMLTEDILRDAYRDPANPDPPDIPPYLRPEGITSWPPDYPQEFRDSTPVLAGYTFADGSDHRTRGYFAHASRVAFDFQMQGLPRRGLPVTMRDPLDNETTIAYDDPFHLLPVQVTDAVGLTVRAEYDYRVLQARMVTDANGNRGAATFSPLGLVTATTVMGKEGEQAGDTLEAPGSRLEYDFFAFMNRQQPAFLRSIVRQHHVTETDVPLPKRDETIETVEYSDGFGRLLQTRTQAEDVLFGDLSFGGGILSADQSIVTGDAVVRRQTAGDPQNVIVSGWQVYDNKGRVVEKHEPFFATGWDYIAPNVAQMGQKATMFYDPRGQMICTLNPDGSEQRVIYGIPADLTNPEQCAPTPWEAYTYDANDLASVSQGPDAASLANSAPATHHFTPSSIVIDVLGRTSEAIARNRDAPDDPGDPLPPIQELRTQSTYDIRGNVLTVTDALNRVAFRYTYDLANRPWRIDSIDAGLRRMVINVLGNETEGRDSKGALILQAYDRLHRPTRHWARDDAGSPISLRQRMEYGDASIPNQAASERAAMRDRNLLGQLLRHHDEAGLTTVTTVDFKGNVLDKSRRVIADAPILAVFEQAPANAWQVTPFQVDWEQGPQQTLANRESELLEAAAYQTTSSVDALNRIKRMQFPQDVEGRRRELRAEYNRAGGLEQVWLDDILYVERIAYDAKGQRTLIAYGNGVMTRYAYDPYTFRLKRLRSERYSKPDDLSYRPGGEALQDYGYDYDLVGNILGIRDRAPVSGIPNNPDAISAVDSTLAQLLISGNALNRRFDYDPIYRLLSATGRECDRPPDGPPWVDQPRCTDLTRTRAYTERYRYDAMGNMLRLEHRNEPGGFTREFTVESANNRLRRMEISDADYDYAFDANGNMRSETTSRHFEWNHADQMKAFRTQTEGVEPSVHAHYLYDATGQRVKKLLRKQGGEIEVTHYIDATFEHHRWDSGAQANENNHVHVMDDMQRIALLRLGDAHPDDRGPAVQLQLGDHLGSSNVVVDLSGALINREECTPYGETSFGSFAKKRYRFTGKERDEESGLNYHGARYYAPLKGRWVSVDPEQSRFPDWSSFCYSVANPMGYVDPTGTEAEPDNFTVSVDPETGFPINPESDLYSTTVTGCRSSLQCTNAVGGFLDPGPPPLGSDSPGAVVSSVAAGAKVVASLPRWLDATRVWSNRFHSWGLDRAPQSLARVYMRAGGALERFGGSLQWIRDIAHRSPGVSHWSGTAALLDLGLRAVGAPKKVTEVTGVLAEVNAPATVFAGYIAGGSSIQALMNHGRDAGPVIQRRNLSHKHGTTVQGLSFIITLIFGSDEQQAEMAEMITSDEARRGDYGFAVKLGRILNERFTSDEFTLNPLEAEIWDKALFRNYDPVPMQ
ncbi:MAG: SpvB/TcaC N-terminal domain-containing protein [Deltaproteobacteria bacterium]|nr:SpvB/TcaC N-terminal domain-containing protein [Deltaproteobacteria bacterium]